MPIVVAFPTPFARAEQRAEALRTTLVETACTRCFVEHLVYEDGSPRETVSSRTGPYSDRSLAVAAAISLASEYDLPYNKAQLYHQTNNFWGRDEGGPATHIFRVVTASSRRGW